MPGSEIFPSRVDGGVPMKIRGFSFRRKLLVNGAKSKLEGFRAALGGLECKTSLQAKTCV